MCGIHGFNWKNIEQIKTMIAIAHSRGPDGNGYYINDNISLGHNLLAITEDAKLSKQPWVVDNNYILVYNGEIYNYQELKQDLKQYYSFPTESDTEILARGLQKYGSSFIYKLDGMYALAWYNKRDNTLLLARDQSGIKPLYYIYQKNKLAFSSNIKTLLSLKICSKKLDSFGLYLYNRLGYVPGPKTILRDVKKLYPGQILQFDLNTNKVILNTHTHFKLTNDVEFDPSEYRKQINNTIQKCSMGRRNIGLFLSGGLDSSVILHEMCQFQVKPETFTTKFITQDKKINEDANIAFKLSKHYKTNHHEINISLQSFIDIFDKCIDVLEEPHANFNIPAYLLLNEYMASNGIVVTLSGDGGDEILTGYGQHLLIKNVKSSIHSLQQWYDLELYRYHTQCKDKIQVLNYIQSWFPIDCLGPDSINNHLYIESLMHLPEQYLIRNDKLGMSVSMEGRFPFTVPSLKEYILNIPSRYKISHTNISDKLLKFTKLLPKVSYKNYLPDYIIDKPKTGWSVPKKEWLFNSTFSKKYNVNIAINWKESVNKLFFRLWLDKLNTL